MARLVSVVADWTVTGGTWPRRLKSSSKVKYLKWPLKELTNIKLKRYSKEQWHSRFVKQHN